MSKSTTESGCIVVSEPVQDGKHLTVLPSTHVTQPSHATVVQ